MMGAGIQHTNQPVRGDPMPGSAVMMSCRGIVSRPSEPCARRKRGSATQAHPQHWHWARRCRLPMDVDGCCRAAQDYPLPAGAAFEYGTAGFRTHASRLLPVAFRVGALAAARSVACGGGATGVVVTASHNPEEDNGVKVVDPSGAMLPVAWEKHATAVVNARGAPALAAALLAAVQDTTVGPAPATVLVARDTRPSGQALMAAVMAGAAALGAVVHDLGELTTPALHLAVYDTAGGQARTAHGESFGAHVDRLVGGYAALMAHAPPAEQPVRHTRLVLDCANGVGAAVAAAVGTHPGVVATGLAIQPVNTSRAGLNAACGADYVQKKQRMPGGMAAAGQAFWGDGAVHWASLDGDADRLVYVHPRGQPPGDGELWPLSCLLDGDKTMCLLATHAVSLIRTAGLGTALLPLAAVQTAYANGGSTAYMRTALGADVEVVTTPTGVKHLHAAAEHHDVALYWEANGHGAMVFSARARAAIGTACDSGDASAAAAARQLAAMDRVTNPAVGDGLSTVMLVEAVLACRGMSVGQWSALYADLPCCHTACRVEDRSAVKTAPGDERVCVAPPGLQEAVDGAVAGAGPGARAFVRASGTEDLVRVYAEAATQPAAEQLARDVARAVHSLAHGVGDAP